MKKTIALFLTVIALAISFSACSINSCAEGHSYTDGVCTVCGEADPDYLPPVEANYNDVSAFQTSSDNSYKYGSLPLRSGTDTELYNVMYIPTTNQEKYTTVVMLHGLNATADGMAVMAKELVQYGYACLTFDFVNGSNLSKSGNKMKKMSLLTEKNDLMAVMEQLKKVNYVDQDNIFIYSESQGGAVTVFSLAEIQDQIQGIILSYPALQIPETIRANYPDKDNIPETVNMGGCALGKIYAVDAYDIDFWALCAQYSGNVLIMHGDQDTSVDLSFSQKAVTCFPNAELVVYEGAGHGFGFATYRVPTMLRASQFINSNVK